MPSSSTDNTSETKRISLRITPALYEDLSSLANRWGGKSISETTTIALESALRSPAMADSVELFEQPEKTLLNLWDAVRQKRALSVKEWCFISSYAYLAYRSSPPSCAPRLIESNLRAFCAALRLVPDVERSAKTTRYYLLNLIGSSRYSAQEPLSLADIAEKTAAHTVNRPPPPYQCAAYSKCLAHLIEDRIVAEVLAGNLTIERLDQTLRPYLNDHLLLATYYHRKASGRPLPHFSTSQTSLELDGDLPHLHKYEHLQFKLHMADLDILWSLRLTANNVVLGGGYVELEDLSKLILDECQVGELFVATRVDQGQIYALAPIELWQKGTAMRMQLNSLTLCSLTALLRELREQFESNEMLSMIERRYGKA